MIHRDTGWSSWCARFRLKSWRPLSCRLRTVLLQLPSQRILLPKLLPLSRRRRRNPRRRRWLPCRLGDGRHLLPDFSRTISQRRSMQRPDTGIARIFGPYTRRLGLRWTDDWYDRARWEMAAGKDFYDDGVFNRRYGGDLQGVMDQLDYLTDLGINRFTSTPSSMLGRFTSTMATHFITSIPFSDRIRPRTSPMATETCDPATWKWTAADRLFLEWWKAKRPGDPLDHRWRFQPLGPRLLRVCRPARTSRFPPNNRGSRAEFRRSGDPK